jgi:DNA-binding NtrC family response regulator
MTEPEFNRALRDICRHMIGEGDKLMAAVKVFEDQYVNELLLKTKGNVTKAAQMAGVHRNTMHLKLKGE